MAGINVDYSAYPVDTLENLLTKYTTKVIIVDDIMESSTVYSKTYQEILDILKWGFEKEEVRKRELSFKFHREDDTIIQMQIRHFLSHMILWYGFMVTDTYDILDQTFIFDFIQNANMNKIGDYIDDFILENISDADRYTKNEIIDEIVHNMTAISKAFSPLMGMGISIYSIIQAEKRNPRIHELMHGELDPNLQPNEIEEELVRRTNELIQCFENDTEDNDLKPLFKSGNNLSKGQFKEMAVMIGLKADMDGNTIPFLINKNLLVDGLSSPSAYTIDAMSGRKSLVLSKTQMGKPGAFSKKVTNNTTAATLRKDYLVCRSIRPVWYLIEDEDFLKLLDKRYYYDDRGELHLLNYKKDKHLIGQEVAFRSPCTCASKEGVCCACYGKLFDDNKDLASAGAYAATKESEPLGQKVLSNKHEQVTHSTPLQFNPEFDEVCEISTNEISLRSDSNIEDELFITLHGVVEEETEDVSDYYCESFDISAPSSNMVFHIAEQNGSKLYLSEQLVALWKKSRDKSKPISLDSLDEDSAILFNVEFRNAESTQPAVNINKLLNSNSKMGIGNDLDAICQKMARNKIDAGIKYNLVHDEMMIRQLLRKKSNEYEFPDWTANNPNLEDYKILRLDMALFKNPSPIVSLSYGYLKKTLLSPEFYKKTATSNMDPLFMETLSDAIVEE